MEDIIDIYEPVYRESNQLLVVSLITILLVLALVFILLKKFRKKKRVTPSELYSKSLDDLIFLKGELGKTGSDKSLQKLRSILINYFLKIEGLNYSSSTSNELGEVLIIQGATSLGEIYINKFDSVIYGKTTISREEIESIIKETGDHITLRYRSIPDD